jgi:hypothetical protein
MGKGSEDTNPVGTKTGGWIKCADGYWRTEASAMGKNYSKDTKSVAEKKAVAPAAPATTEKAAEKK